MKLETVTRRRPRIFHGWWIVLAAALINVYGAGVWFYGFPIFYKALLDEFGWSAAAGAAIISLSRLEGGIEAPVIGWLVDRFGPRRLAFVGAVITGLGFMVMSRVASFNVGPIHVNAFVAFALLYAGWMSIGYNTGFGHATAAAVNAWFIKKRARAFAIFSLGSGGSGLIVFLLGWLVDQYGWRGAAFWAGVGVFVIVIPLTLLLRHKPEQYGLLPDGEDPRCENSASSDGERDDGLAMPLRTSEAMGAHPPSTAKGQRPEYDFTVKESILTFAFWMLVLGSAARSITMTSVVVHEVVYLTDVRNIPLIQASAALGAMVTVSLVGRLGLGWLGDYVDKRYLLIATYLFQALGIYILSGVTTMSQVWLFVVVYGIAYGGAIPLYLAIVGEYFGRQYYATIRGFMQLFLVPAAVLGPVYAGWVYDTTKSYQMAFTSFIVVLVVGTVFVFLARRPPLPQRSPES
ncbi:MAG: MFS transporter [Chloroflexota bacterium]